MTDPDEAPEPPAVPVTRLGDVWLLGGHRIVCGDATDKAAAAAALAASRDTATNPAVLSAFGLALIGSYGPPAYPGIPGYAPDLAEARAEAATVGNGMAELRRVVPEPAAYVSFGVRMRPVSL